MCSPCCLFAELRFALPTTRDAVYNTKSITWSELDNFLVSYGEASNSSFPVCLRFYILMNPSRLLMANMLWSQQQQDSNRNHFWTELSYTNNRKLDAIIITESSSGSMLMMTQSFTSVFKSTCIHVCDEQFSSGNPGRGPIRNKQCYPSVARSGLCIGTR